jgi:hypothetical protein
MIQIFRPQPWQRGYFPPAGALPSAVLDIGGMSEQAGAQAGMAGYQAQVARNNQMIAEGYAQRALQQGQVDEQTQRLKTAAALGTQRASLASQGSDVDSGSPLDLQGDTARMGEYNAQTVRNNAALKAYGYRVQAYNNAADAGRYDLQAADTMAALPFSIGKSLLNDTNNFASMLARSGT